MDNIFKLIKLKKFNDIKNIILKDKDINLNIYDEQNNYLIHYIILNNELELLKIILKRDIRLDILDMDNRSILFIPIKYNYIEILEILLNYNNKLIGITLLDIKDKFGYTALHYCVIFNNFDCLKILLKANADPLIIDNNSNNVIQLAFQYLKESKNSERILLYLINNYNLDFLTSKNETILQLSLSNINIFNILLKKNINLDNQENEYGLAILHQVILLNKIELTKHIIEYGANINLQDYYGNTPLMYAINDNLIDNIKIFIKESALNYNLVNLSGQTYLHAILKDLNFYINHSDIIEIFIKNTDLNIQDNNGETCTYILAKNNLFIKFKNILEYKELNIFIKNNKNQNIYKILNNDYIEIIINSFYNHLKNNNDKLLIKWEIDCSNKILSEIECKKKIKDIIINEHRSVPKLIDYSLILDNGIFVNTCYYTGAPIDILFGILFLYNKFNSDGLNLIIDYPLTKNDELEKYFTSLGINFNYKLDFCNFEINWSYQKMIYPTYFNEEFKKKCNESNYIIIPLGIEISMGSHANILFCDIKKNTIERFEPNGANPPNKFNYNYELLDNLLEEKFNDFTYISPKKYLPSIGFQILENSFETKCTRIGDPNGFCGVWCIWWIYHKMKNINLDSKLLADKLITEIKFNNISFKIIIRNFSKNISDLRDNFLNKYDIDINNFIENDYDSNLLLKIEKDIINYIN
jgi:ankyrin repeat protein